MFNIGAAELAVIFVVALLLLGPDKLPELARGIGKFMREFRRQTDEVRGMVEREFYQMDQEIKETPAAPNTVPSIKPPPPEAPALPESASAPPTEPTPPQALLDPDGVGPDPNSPAEPAYEGPPAAEDKPPVEDKPHI
jgi:sec-independent protein translocase protein TatB